MSDLENNFYQDGGHRDDFQPSSDKSNAFQQRSSRPRFNRNQRVGGYSSSAGQNRQGYRPRFNQNREDYQPNNRYNEEERGEQGFRPRYNRDNGYQPRSNNYNRQGSYNRQQGEYRPRYSQQGEGDYQPRQYNQNYGNEGQGNYQHRSSGYDRQNNGYARQSNGYNRQGNGYDRQQRGGFNRSRQQRSSNGYDPHAKYSHKKRIEYKEANIDPNEPIRLNKYLANAGICSRRDADKYIEAGVITVNGEIVTELGTKVLRTDTVLFHDAPVKIEHKVYILLNKPKGYVTTSEDPQNRKTVMDLVRGACPERIYPVGRLDRNTTGVLLLTNDGEMAAKLTHPQFMKKKIYHVYLDQNVSAADMRQIAEGITLEDGEIKADEIQYASDTDKKQIGIEIHSGKNRIVRRIFESLGYHVNKLDRVFFAGLTKKHLKRGDWRFLTEEEVNFLRMGSFE